MFKFKKKFKKGFTLIEILVVIAIIGILVAISLVLLNSGKEKAQTVSAQQTAGSILPLINQCATEGGCGINPPNNVSLGGGKIFTKGSDVEWPSLKNSGYSYQVISNSDISSGDYSFRLIKDDKPSVIVYSSDSTYSIKIEKQPTVVLSPCPPAGDANEDGKLTSEDSSIIRYTIARKYYPSGAPRYTPPSEAEKKRMDTDTPMYSPPIVLTENDALLVDRLIEGLISTFPSCPVVDHPRQ